MMLRRLQPVRQASCFRSVRSRRVGPATPGCNNRMLVCTVVLLFIALLSVYLYLYTKTFVELKTATLFHVIQNETMKKNKAGSVTQYPKLMRASDQLEIGGLSVPTTSNEAIIGLTTTTKLTTAPEMATTVWEASAKQLNSMVETYKQKILDNTTEPLLTLFTAWMQNQEKILVHNLTVNNWLSLRPFVVPVLFTDEPVIKENAIKGGLHVFPKVRSAVEGIHVLKYMYRDVTKKFNTTFYAYSRGDILFSDSLIKTLISLEHSNVNLTKPVLIVGKLVKVNNVTLAEGSSWKNIAAIGKSRGKLFTGYAEEFFITSAAYQWSDSAEVDIAQKVYDNWLVYTARKLNHTVIDASATVLAVHQTTKAKHFEGHGHKHGESNHNHLVKINKRVKYRAGVIDCIETFTQYENESIKVFSRNVSKECAV